jgi:hypothetical protein
MGMRPKRYEPEEFIFRSKKGGIIDFGDFLNHAWKGYKNRHGRDIDGLVTKLVKQGVVSEYRRPYRAAIRLLPCVWKRISTRKMLPSGWGTAQR